jgi:hypothetical protein
LWADQDYSRNLPAVLSQDLIAALRAQGGLELEVIDPETLREYVVVGAGMHREAMEALRCQQNLQAIARGFAELQAGQGMELSVAMDSIRETLGLLARSP